MDAAFCVNAAKEHPYDGRPAKSKEHLAALAVIEDLLDRRGIKWQLADIDKDVRCEIVDNLAAVIALALTKH